MQRIIELIVSPTGETKVQTKGYSGADCQEATRFLEKALGVTTSDIRTADFYEASTTEQQVQQE
jgi:hypothetical protein